jgi:hypothetical protein
MLNMRKQENSTAPNQTAGQKSSCPRARHNTRATVSKPFLSSSSMIAGIGFSIREKTMRIMLAFLFALVAISAAADPKIIIADSTSSHSIVLRENLGHDIAIDSVTLCIEKDGSIYVTRSKRAYGSFPREIYSIIVELFY